MNQGARKIIILAKLLFIKTKNKKKVAKLLHTKQIISIEVT